LSRADIGLKVGIPPALSEVMTMQLLLTFAGAMFLASIGAFFLFVPVLSIGTMISILVGLTLMFWLGVQAGSHGILTLEKAVK
jgi:hypothetical protein